MSAPELVSEANRWLLFATEDLKVAQNLLASNEAAPRHICFLAQQAAEKALKAALVLEEMDFLFRHDIQVIGKSQQRWMRNRQYYKHAVFTTP